MIVCLVCLSYSAECLTFLKNLRNTIILLQVSKKCGNLEQGHNNFFFFCPEGRDFYFNRDDYYGLCLVGFRGSLEVHASVCR